MTSGPTSEHNRVFVQQNFVYKGPFLIYSDNIFKIDLCNIAEGHNIIININVLRYPKITIY